MLAKDLVSSNDEEQFGNKRLHRIWQLSQFALEAKNYDHQETKEGDLRKPKDGEAKSNAQSHTDSSHQALVANIDEGIDIESLQEQDKSLYTTEELTALLPAPIQKPTNTHDSKTDTLKSVFYAINSLSWRLCYLVGFFDLEEEVLTLLIQLMHNDLMALEF
ncbi:uncharacterized protein MELLADRAFT_68164 [Melampsora larici-populina 98AG31]|uniref:Uncharacterized protein n=1 Tax=Melampsora larici-populina (strain 98AG31 / pathotype 3-4-7) TaxID=747676 RepID=F4S5T2_MELLP|nr:uncharacterized protein MELLADRAFT_68164 [Melampsora larici-populina 98AG31]EGG00008.1 hypothetical protein MELLADRAFT_68164 [Melampsora larici-populina 98AG31]